MCFLPHARRSVVSVVAATLSARAVEHGHVGGQRQPATVHQQRQALARDLGCGRLCLAPIAMLSRRASGLTGENSVGDSADNPWLIQVNAILDILR